MNIALENLKNLAFKMNYWIVAHYDLRVYNISEKVQEPQESGTLLTHEMLHKIFAHNM